VHVEFFGTDSQVMENGLSVSMVYPNNDYPDMRMSWNLSGEFDNEGHPIHADACDVCMAISLYHRHSQLNASVAEGDNVEHECLQ